MTQDLDDYRQSVVPRPGTFRAWPITWTAEKAKESAAVAAVICFAIHQEWSPTERTWSQEWPPGYYAIARAWIVKKDGELNAAAIENLKKCNLWDGDFDKFAAPPPTEFVHLDVEEESFEGKTRLRGSWINPDLDEPQPRGTFAPADPKLLESLRARFGSQSRAIAGGSSTGSPPAPPKPAAATAAATTSAAPAAPSGAAAKRTPPAPGAPAPKRTPPAATTAASAPQHPPARRQPPTRPAPAPAVEQGDQDSGESSGDEDGPPTQIDLEEVPF